MTREYYSVGDREEITAESDREAVEQWLDEYEHIGTDDELCFETGFVKVTKWIPEEIPDHYFTSHLVQLMEMIDEDFKGGEVVPQLAFDAYRLFIKCFEETYQVKSLTPTDTIDVMLEDYKEYWESIL